MHPQDSFSIFSLLGKQKSGAREVPPIVYLMLK